MKEPEQSEPRMIGAETPTLSFGRDPADQLVAAVNSGVDRILQAFDQKLRHDDNKQQAIDCQHEELMGHRRNPVARAAKPFVYGLIHRRTEIGKLIAAMAQESVAEMPLTKVCEMPSSLQEDVGQVLEENGVAACRPEVGAPFDPERQRVVGNVRLTCDETRSATIADAWPPGYEQGGRILVETPCRPIGLSRDRWSPEVGNRRPPHGRRASRPDCPALGKGVHSRGCDLGEQGA